jgi:hypothetical protein
MNIHLTDAEARFMTMFRMVSDDRNEHGFWTIEADETRDDVRSMVDTAVIIIADGSAPHEFGIVAQSFAALCAERPELQEFYDRAEAAWEASQ